MFYTGWLAREVGSHRLMAEVIAPEPRGQQVDVGGQVRVDPQKHVREVSVRVDVIKNATLDQAVEDRSVASPYFRDVEHPVLPADRRGPQGSLNMVGIDRDRGIV